MNANLFPEVFKDFHKSFIGFDDVYEKLHKTHEQVTKHIPNYPPYNIKKVEDNKYVIELAVAGFAKQDIEITLEENVLHISGLTKEDNPEDFIFKGIANRTFKRTFALDDHIEIQGAEMLNGMLRVALEQIIPEYKKPKKIDIKDKEQSKEEVSKKQLLTEDKDW